MDGLFIIPPVCVETCAEDSRVENLLENQHTEVVGD